MRVRVRTKVLEHVSRHPGAEAAPIARALGLSTPAVQHHLRILQSDGRIESAPTPSGGGRGRPRLGYRVSPALEGNNLAMLTEHLLSGWNEVGHGGEREADLVGILASRLSEQLRPTLPLTSATRRLAALVERLNQMHYKSRWEAGPEGPRLIFGHCPYAAVVARHPELCRMDATAVGAIMGADAQQKAKIDPETIGPSNCLFTLTYR